MGPAVGLLLSSGFFLVLTSSLSGDQFALWGWRLPFLASIVLVAIGLYVRVTISETPVFKQAMETRARVPFWDMVRTYPRALLLSSGGMALAYVLFYTITTFSLSDRVGRRRLGLGAAVLAGLWAFPLFWLLDTRNPLLIALSFSVGMVVFAMLYGPMGASLPELYGTRLRYSGAAVSYNLDGALGGRLPR